MLRDYASNLDPLQHNSVIVQQDEVDRNEAEQTTATEEPSISQAVEEKTSNSPSISMASSARLPPHAMRCHRKNTRSAEIPRQTIIKALASRPSGVSTTTSTLALASSLSSPVSSPEADRNLRPLGPSSQRPPKALTNLQSTITSNRASFCDRLPLQSPCFVHKRFDEAVNIDKVLEDIADDEWLSHSRLMHTATGVRELSKQLQRRPIKRAVRSVMIVTKARDNRLVYLTRDLAEWLMKTPRYGEELGVDVYVDEKLRSSKRFDAAGLLQERPEFRHMLKYWTPDLCWSSADKFDLVLTLGGDGTVLFTSWLFQRVVPPILSFALGSLGFLTNFRFEDYQNHLNQIMGDSGMRVNLRMRFTCTVWRIDRTSSTETGAMEEGEQFEVLNELVIDRGPSPYVSNLELYGENELLTVVQADGCIFSTPTGSTAYSLSAGGSLIHPSIPAILLTPICPHTLSFRPMVLSDTVPLKIAVPSTSRSTAYCSFDGKGKIELKQGDFVTLEASQYPFPTLMRGANEWVESVQRALRWNVRGAVQKGWDGDHEKTDVFNDNADTNEQQWDIDTEPYPAESGTDSGIGHSEDDGPTSALSFSLSRHETPSPPRKQMSLLNM